MSVNKYKLLTFIIAFFAVNTLSAQIRPVRVSVQLVPPYSGYLPDYADPSAEKLKIVLQFNDFSQAQYQVKLKFEIKGNGFALTSKAFINVPPITLIPGQPVLLSGSDLAPYLSSNNLDFTGLNQSQYEQRMALPEGNYQICVTAYDYYNSQIAKLSDEVCAQAWFTLSNPPLLNLPVCNSLITPQTPQNLIFQWTPLNLGSPLSALTTEYEFALWECRPDSFVNENQLVLSTAPIYSIVTQQTYLNYGLAEPPLNVYMKYVWRVRAKDISGRDLFVNNGKSEICTFFYGQASNVLGDALNLNITAQGLSQFSGRCNFNTQSAYTNYQVNMRKKGTNNWFISYTNTGTKSFHNLQGSNEYECRVRGYEPIQGNWSNIATFTTNPPPLAGCNDAAPNIPPNTTPLPLDRAVPGLKVQTTQYVLLIKSIQALPNPGWFKGNGYVNTFGMPLPVEFDAIFIDENSIHQQGIIRAKTTGLDAWLAESDLETASNNATYISGTLTNVTLNGNQYCYTIQGNPTPTCVPIDTTKKITVIRDDAGNQYVINTGPPPTVTGPTSYLNPSTDNLAASDSLKVVFAAAANQAFGFDSRQYAAFTNDYELIKLANNSNYFVPNKSIGDNATDRAIANFTINNFVEANLAFKTKSGTVLNKTKAVGANTYTINGITAGADCIYAWYNNQKIGKLNIISLTKVNKKVVLVPVNGASTAGLTQQGLNDIYKQANTTFTLTTAPNFTFDLGNDGLEAADAKLMSKYSAEMRALRDAYKTKDSLYDKNAYYLFVIPNFSNPQLQGYMVRGRAVGFIKTGATVTDVAHELGHGAFKLEHTFDAIAKGSSNNLMDYNNGTHLVKSQWLNIQNPTNELTWFDGEEDGSMSDPEKKLDIEVYDTIITNKKIIFKLQSKEFKVYLKFNDNDTLTEKTVNVDYIVFNEKSKKILSKSLTIQKNKKIEIIYDSVPSGRYQFEYINSNKKNIFCFFYRKNKPDYACTKCGKDLKLTLNDLKAIIGENHENATEIVCGYFNDVLKKVGFKSCESLAHYFSQLKAESNYLKNLDEDLSYTYKGVLNTFKYNSNVGLMFKQSFWDNKTYKDYFWNQVYEIVDTTNKNLTGSHAATQFQKFKWLNKSNSVEADTVRIPISFSTTKTPKIFNSVTFTATEKLSRNKKLFSLIYANMNGNGGESTEDGYNFTGGGGIHITGKTTYKESSDRCNELFGTSYDFVNNAQLVKTDIKAALYSSAGYMNWKFKRNVESIYGKTVEYVTEKVNGGDNGLLLRKSTFNSLISNFYKCINP